MSLTLKFSSNIIPPFPKGVASDEVTFHQSSSVKLMQPGVVDTVDVTEKIDGYFQYKECHFMGRITLPNEPSARDVIVKILWSSDEESYSETLQNYHREAKFYRDHLCRNESLYGKGVPKHYGLYETKLYWKLYDIFVHCACMVYQYCGSNENLAWSTGSGLSDFGVQAVKLLLQMHKSGIRHNNFDLDENITCLDDKPFIVDFSQACYHDCPDKEFEYPARLFDVDPDSLGCSELCDSLARLRRHVAPFFFHWYGYDVWYRQVKSLDDIFQQERRTTFGRDATIEEQWEYAVKVWKFLCANWASYYTEKAPEVGDTSFEAYKARCGEEIIYDDDKYEYNLVDKSK